VRFLFYVRETPKTIRDITESVMRRVVGNRLGSDVLTVGRVEVSSEQRRRFRKSSRIMRPVSAWWTVELQDVPLRMRSSPRSMRSTRPARTGNGRSIRPRSRPIRKFPKPEGWRRRASARPKATPSRGSTGPVERPTVLMPYWTSIHGPERSPRRRLYLESLAGFLAEMKGVYIVDTEQKALVPWLPLESGAKTVG